MPDDELTQALLTAGDGDPKAAQRLLPLVYDRLRDLAESYLARESSGHTLQATALVHEAWLKLVNQDRVDWQGRTHFFAVGAQTMRRILVDHARGKRRLKRGSGQPKIALDEELTLSPRNDEDLILLDDVLNKLEETNPRRVRIIEMRFFAGMSMEEVAAELGIAKRTAEKEWTLVRAWLRRELGGET